MPLVSPQPPPSNAPHVPHCRHAAQLGSFSLKVTRSLEAAAPAAPPAAAAPPPAPAAPAPVVVLTAGNGSAAYESIDEALVYVTSPKVRPGGLIDMIGRSDAWKHSRQAHQISRPPRGKSGSVYQLSVGGASGERAVVGELNALAAERRGGSACGHPISRAFKCVRACLRPQVGIFRRGKYAAGKRVGKGDLVNAVSTKHRPLTPRRRELAACAGAARCWRRADNEWPAAAGLADDAAALA
jgi:hypothetical protein